MNSKKTAISEEQALKEFNAWLDSKKISEKKRVDKKDAEEIIIAAIVDGLMVINEDNTITLTLLFPVESGKAIDKLTFKHRLTVGEKNNAVKGLKPEDGDSRMLAYISALSNTAAGFIRVLDSGDDYERASAIAVYFL